MRRELTPDEKWYAGVALFVSACFYYLALVGSGEPKLLLLAIAVLEMVVAVAIYFQVAYARWLYLASCVGLLAWMVFLMTAHGYTHVRLAGIVASIVNAWGFFVLPGPSQHQGKDEDEIVGSELYSLPDHLEPHVEDLTKSYEKTFGDLQWVHHVVPKGIWLHKYADHVVTSPPTQDRKSWLYGTLLISAMSGDDVEIILERSEEDTIHGIGTLSKVTEYYLEYLKIEPWHTAGTHAFFGEDSDVRGLLFVPAPKANPSTLQVGLREISLLYVIGITLDQMEKARAMNDEMGDYAGCKALYAELEHSKIN